MQRVVKPMRFKDTLASMMLNKKYWFVHFWLVSIMCVLGLVYMGDRTYEGAPPLGDYVNEQNQVVISEKQIKDGEKVFHLRGLMNYGSFWGDGAGRGPDFTAEALNITVKAM
jgi:nitric oxide reductase subunit B